MVDIKLPLFPLNTVLFPGVPLTLHIFEERYRLMVGYCLDTRTSFGVVFLGQNDYEDSSDDAASVKLGTVAHINASIRLEDGRYLITTIGRQRFRVRNIVQYVPYIVATVDFLPEEETEIHTDVDAQQLRTAYRQYWQAVAVATGSSYQEEHLPTNAVLMGYHIAHRMKVANKRKQQWLETDSTTRIRELTALLRTEMSWLPHPDEQAKPVETTWHWSRN